jgi:pyruvate dehydrogenase complex dehydrogenase (E1) component
VTVATLSALARSGELDPKVVAQAIKDLGIDPGKKNPRLS